MARPKVIKIRGRRYKTINECMAAYFDCDKNALDSLSGHMEMRYADGSETNRDVQQVIKDIRKRRCWGWLENKTFIHYFVRKSATMKDLIKLFAHEIGHMQRPFHRTIAEEQKADRYGKNADAAYQLAAQTFKEMKG